MSLKVFAISYNHYKNSLMEAKFYSTRKKARTALKEIIKKCDALVGAEILITTQDWFSFITGSEEREHSYEIIKLKVE